jgi:L-rhamnose isomerase
MNQSKKHTRSTSMAQDLTARAFETAKERYAEMGVDVEAAMELVKTVSLSIHCWQGDDIGGFEISPEGGGGGIQVTGNYPGRARNMGELQADVEKLMSLLPGQHRLALHAIYGDFEGKPVDRDEIEVKHFAPWAEWSREQKIGLDFNSTFIFHSKADDGFTLSSKDPEIRDFWIEHAKRCREISAYLGKNQGNACIHNLWIPDGMKDLTIDKKGYRKILLDSLDEIFKKEYTETELKDAVESKLFGIGSESFVVGSHEFYLGYALTRDKLVCLDLGHFHPTESVADKLSAVLQFLPEVLLHVSRGVRWDSDHIVILNDDITYLCQDIVRGGYLTNVHIGLDFFDATLNRLGAWVIGARAVLKGLLRALLEPTELFKSCEDEGRYFDRLALLEESKTLPFGAVWDYYCETMATIPERSVISEVTRYEEEVLRKRE